MRARSLAAVALGAWAVPGQLAAKVPVDPDADTARRWLEEELARPGYSTGTDLLTWIMNWINEQLDRFANSLDAAPGQSLAIAVGIVALIALIVTFAVTGPVRARRHAAPSAVLLEGEERTGAELLADAQARARREDFTGAFVGYFRAIARRCEERVIIDPKPGRTAHELPGDTQARLPGFATQLEAMARRFDQIAYGRATAGRADAEAIAHLYGLMEAARPVSPHVPQLAQAGGS